MNIDQLSWTTFSPRSPSQGIPLRRPLKRPQLALQKFRDLVLLVAFFVSMHDPEFHHLMVATAKAAPQTFRSSTSASWFVSIRSSNTHFLGSSSTTCIIRGLQELPGLCVPSRAVPPTNIREVEVPQEKQGL